VNPDATPLDPPPSGAVRPDVRFLFAHPAHAIALGFGSGLSPRAPGTVGTLWAWLVFWLLRDALPGDGRVGLVLVAAACVAWWTSTVTARHLRSADPSSIVVDEVVAFWIVLWLLWPQAGFWGQLVAFGLFRFFDAAKPGPVAWADKLFKRRRDGVIGPAQGFGIVFDDLVAALCTLLVIALWRFFFA
jgi:phosphatidylglycerophosphatase A